MSELMRLLSELGDHGAVTPVDCGKAADEAFDAGDVEAAMHLIELAYLVSETPSMLLAEAIHRHRIH